MEKKILAGGENIIDSKLFSKEFCFLEGGRLYRYRKTKEKILVKDQKDLLSLEHDSTLQLIRLLKEFLDKARVSP